MCSQTKMSETLATPATFHPVSRWYVRRLRCFWLIGQVPRQYAVRLAGLNTPHGVVKLFAPWLLGRCGVALVGTADALRATIPEHTRA